MRKITGLILIFMISIAAFAETVNLTGTVSNKNGDPIEGAIVTLKGKNQSDTTDSDGNYALQSSAIRLNLPFITRTEKITFNNGTIWFKLTKPAQVNIDMFDISGKLIKRELNNYATAGEYQYKIAGSAAANSMKTIRVSIGNNSSTFCFFRLADGKQAVTASNNATVSKSNGTLAKMSATVDSLNVSAPGYKEKSVPVSNYDSKIDITLDSNGLAPFSFFVTSLKALRKLSGSNNGFGGDFRFGKTGQGAGLLGADSICSCIAEMSMPGSSAKKWRAFLSAAKGPDGKQVNAIDRIGKGPWYDRKGRLVAETTADLISSDRPKADVAIKNDLPNEDGIPNHTPDPTKPAVDNHLTITGSNTKGELFGDNCTCDDWTSTSGKGGSRPRAGMSWPQNFGGGGGGFGGMDFGMKNWISTYDVSGCEPGIDSTDASMAGSPNIYTIGNGGGYGGFYCFGLNP